MQKCSVQFWKKWALINVRKASTVKKNLQFLTSCEIPKSLLIHLEFSDWFVFICCNFFLHRTKIHRVFYYHGISRSNGIRDWKSKKPMRIFPKNKNNTFRFTAANKTILAFFLLHFGQTSTLLYHINGTTVLVKKEKTLKTFS